MTLFNFRISLAVASLTVTSLVSLAQTDFRKSNWGDNKVTVINSEKQKPIAEEPNRIIFECMLDHLKGKLMYTFSTSDELLRSKYLFNLDYTNMYFFVRDYQMLQEVLKSKYGEPTTISVVTVNKQTLKESEWPANLLTGNLRIETKWHGDKTDILLTISKVGDKFPIQIDYVSNVYTKKDLEEKKAKIVDDL